VDSPKERWVGWEYEDDAGIHLVVSSRHLLVDGKLLCGVIPPKWVTVSGFEGDEPCKRCEKIIRPKAPGADKQPKERKSKKFNPKTATPDELTRYYTGYSSFESLCLDTPTLRPVNVGMRRLGEYYTAATGNHAY
jgi:hypothetical protein